MSDRKRFESLIYTKLDMALFSLEKREKDSIIFDVPETFQGGKNAVIFRQLASPNYETIRFLTVVPENLKPVFFEFHSDKFTTQNSEKYALAKLHFYNGFGKKGGMKVDSHKIIDFNASDGKRLNEVTTLWGQSLTEFHRDLFSIWNNKKHQLTFFDASHWFDGRKAQVYYQDFLKIFIKNGVLFENFMLESKKERNFIKQAFLPAFLKVWIETGYKPLIVSLEPTAIEGEKFWSYYPVQIKEFVEAKIKSLNTK